MITNFQKEIFPFCQIHRTVGISLWSDIHHSICIIFKNFYFYLLFIYNTTMYSTACFA